MLDKADTNSSKKVVIKARIDKADENLGSPVPVPIYQDVAAKPVSN